ARAPPGQRETSAEHWHHLLGDALELFEHHGFRRAQAGAQIDMLHARKARFEPLEVFDQLFSRARKPRAKLHIVVERRHTRLAPAVTCAEVIPGTNPSGANIFTCSSKYGVSSRIALSRVSAT